MITTGELSKTAAKQLDDLLKVIHESKATFNRSVIDIGRALDEAKGIVLEHKLNGGFVEWVERECNFSRQTAYRYIDAFKMFGSCNKMLHFDDTALYLLAKCEPAAEKAKALANKGQHITAERAKELVAEVKPPKPKAKPLPPADDPAPGSDREPGDDTEAIAAEAAKRKASGKEKVPPKMRKEAMRALGVVIRFIDRLDRHDEAREHLEAITAIVKGTS